MSKATEENKKESSSLRAAFYITGGWFLFIFIVAVLNFSLNSPSTVNLNELGDFFAGASSPLAIFWLVMVYMQQRREMREQVKQTKVIAEETRKQVENIDEQFKKQYEPFFVCQNASVENVRRNDLQAVITVENIGGIATHLDGKLHCKGKPDCMFKFEIKEREKDSSIPVYTLNDAVFAEKGQEVIISFYIHFNSELEKTRLYTFEIFYKDLLGREFRHEGQYQYGDDMTSGGRLHGKTKGIKRERVFLVPARPVLMEV